MVEFASLLEDIIEKPRTKTALVQITKKPVKTKHNKELGCNTCPANKKRAKKIFADVRGKSIFVIAQNPGRKENEEGRPLIGSSGEFLWRELKKVGIRRSDCDITNAVRCLCYDEINDDGPISRTPTPLEVKHCSVHTKSELEKSKAKIFLVFGHVAAKQVFGNESSKKTKMFWSDKLQARVYILDHPAYFLRGGPSQRLKEFRAALRAAGNDFAALKSGKSSLHRYTYLDKQDYAGIFTYRELRTELKLLRKKAAKGIRITVDTEEDVIDGKKILLGVGFCYKAGRARTVVLNHPLAPKRNKKELRRMRKLCVSIISDPFVKKAFQHGSHDCTELKKAFDVDVKGYDYDTEYAEYMSNPNRKAFGLDEVINARFPNFSGYKSIVMPEAAPENTDKEVIGCDLPKGFDKFPVNKQYDFFRKKGLLHYSKIPLDKFILYNCADCDVTKRIEVTTKDKIPYQLLQIYIACGFVLDKMQANGPVFDYKHAEKLQEFYPPREAWLLAKLRKMAKSPKLNPNSHPQIRKIIFEDLKLQRFLDKDAELNTRKTTMQILSRESKFAKYLLEYRRVAKIVSTYLKGFIKCADNNGGLLKTKWWLTGTSTGRLSSGGGRGTKEDDVKVVNLQNIHSDPYIQDVAVPDRDWRLLYNALLEKIKDKAAGSLGQIKTKLRNWYEVDDKEKKGEIWKSLDALRDSVLDSLESRIQLGEKFLEVYGNIRVLLGYDFGQIEIRVAAQVSGDKNLQRDCAAGDIHSLVGHVMTGWDVEKIKKDKQTRTLTKNVHFGILYGLAAKGLVAFLKAKDPDTKITIELAEQYIANYFKRYKKVKRFIEKCRGFVEQHGYIKNIFGFCRPLDTHEHGGEKSDDGYDEEGGGAYWGNQAVNCVDFSTEALTQRGWVRGDKVRRGDIFLTYNLRSQRMEWQTVTDIKLFPNYRGPIHYLKSKSFSAITTPDHRWAIRDKKYAMERTSKTLPKNWGSIPRVGNYLGPGRNPYHNYSDDFVRLIGWVLTDGSYGRRYTDISQGHSTKASGWAANRVSVYQSKPKNVVEIDALFSRLQRDMGLYFRTKAIHNRKTNDEIKWSFSGTFGRWFKGMFPDRVLTPDFLIQLPKKQLKILLNTVWLGDAGVARSKKAIDAIQMLCVLCDVSSSVRYRDMSKYIPESYKMGNVPKMKGCWVAKKHRRKHISCGWIERVVKEKAIGMWCPIVPNTFFVARRKGQVYITGNTPIQGAAHQLMLMAMYSFYKKAAVYLKKMGWPSLEVHDALYFFPKLKHMAKAFRLGKKLLEQEPLNVVKKRFKKIKWTTPLAVEGKAGLRLGDTVEIEGLSFTRTLLTMALETYVREQSLKIEMERQVV